MSVLKGFEELCKRYVDDHPDSVRDAKRRCFAQVLEKRRRKKEIEDTNDRMLAIQIEMRSKGDMERADMLEVRMRNLQTQKMKISSVLEMLILLRVKRDEDSDSTTTSIVQTSSKKLRKFFQDGKNNNMNLLENTPPKRNTHISSFFSPMMESKKRTSLFGALNVSKLVPRAKPVRSLNLKLSIPVLICVRDANVVKRVKKKTERHRKYQNKRKKKRVVRVVETSNIENDNTIEEDQSKENIWTIATKKQHIKKTSWEANITPSESHSILISSASSFSTFFHDEFKNVYDSGSQLVELRDIVVDSYKCLQGIPSHTFIYDDMKKRFRLKKRLRLSTGTETSLYSMLDPISMSGTRVRSLWRFVQHFEIASSGGLIAQSFALGVRDYLEAHRSEVSRLENFKTTRGLVTFRVTTTDLGRKLRSLCELCCVDKNEDEDKRMWRRLPRGAALLAHISRSIDCTSCGDSGDASIGNLFRRLFVLSFVPYAKMMDTWIRLGKISHHEDPYCEFMVQCVPRHHKHHHEEEEEEKIKSGVRHNVGNLVVVRRSEAHVPQFLGSDTVANIWTCGMLLCRMRHDNTEEYYKECTNTTTMRSTRIYFKPTLQSIVVSKSLSSVNRRLGLLRDRRELLRNDRERRVTLLSQERARVAEERRLQREAAKRRKAQESREERERKRALFARMKRDAREAMKRRKARERKEKEDDMETIRIARERGMRRVVGEPVDERLKRLAKQRIEAEFREKEAALVKKYGGVSGGGVGKKKRTGVRVTQDSGGNSVAHDIIYGDRLVAQKNSVRVLAQSGGGQSEAFDAIYGADLSNNTTSMTTSVRVLKPSGDASTMEDILTGKAPISRKNASIKVSQPSGGNTEADGVIYGTSTLDTNTKTSVKVSQPSGGNTKADGVIYGTSTLDTNTKTSVKVSQPSGGNTKADGVIYGTSTLDTNTKTSVKVSQPSGGNTKADGVIYGTSTLDTNTKTSVKVSQPSGGNTEADGVIYGTSTLDTNTKTSVKVSQPSGGKSKADGIIYGTATLDNNTKTSVKVSQPSGGNTKADGIIYGTSTLDNNTKTSVKVSQPSGGNTKADGIIYGTSTLDNNTKTSVKVSQPSGGNTKAHGIIYGTSKLETNMRTSVKVSQPSGGITTLVFGDESLMRHEEKTESDDFNLPTFESEISIFSNQQQQQQQNSWSQDLIRTFLPGQKGTSWIIPSSTNKYRPSCSTLGHSTFWSPTTVTRDFYNKFKNEEGEEDEFLTPLRVALQQCVRDPLQMQLRVVEQAAVDIVIGPKQLESHISVLREFMLMESGLVFDLFVEEAYARTITSGRGPTPMHLNHIFETSLQRAGHSSTGPFVKRFMYKRTTSSAKMTTTMTVPKSTTTTRALLKSLNRLRATYQIESTSMLRLVITEESIRKYAQIHSALLETRCVQYSLRRLWVRLNFVLRQQKKQDNMVLARQMSSLQRSMRHVVDTLNGYLSTQVLHGFAWLELRRKLCDGSLITVKDLRLAHETFLSATARACFISENVMTSKIVRDAVSRCYDCIMRFCETVDLRRGIQLDADFQGISRSFRASTFELCASLRTYAICHGHLAHDQIKELRMALDPDFFCGV